MSSLSASAESGIRHHFVRYTCMMRALGFCTGMLGVAAALNGQGAAATTLLLLFLTCLGWPVLAWRLSNVAGNPLDADTIVGPMARGNFADHVRQQTEEAIRGGATRHLNSKHDLDRPGSPYLAPEVLTNVNHQMSVLREESFGPVVGIMKVADDAEAITLMNDSPYGLTASIWTEDLDAAASIGAKVETGTVFANRCDYLDPALVWTGVKDTGKGGGLSEIGYHNLTQPKSYHLKRA